MLLCLMIFPRRGSAGVHLHFSIDLESSIRLPAGIALPNADVTTSLALPALLAMTLIIH